VMDVGEEPDEDVDMQEDKGSEMEKLRQFIAYGTTMGCCVKIATAKLEELTPKLRSSIDQAKAGKDIAGERLRLTKQQETSEVSLTAERVANTAKTTMIRERQIVLEAEAVAEATAAAAAAAERHNNNLEAIRRDCARIIERNDKENDEIEEKLSKLKERYDSDFSTLDEMQAKQTLRNHSTGGRAGARSYQKRSPSRPRSSLHRHRQPSQWRS
jgi:hypothetical protein